jgi:hypothetical protein
LQGNIVRHGATTLEPILGQRDAVTTAITKSDAGALETLRGAMTAPVGKEGGTRGCRRHWRWS